MRFWANLVGYQLVWFAVVIAAAQQRPWLAVAAALAFTGAQWRASRERASDARLVVCAVALGIVFDGALAGSGWLRYASALPAVLAPVWILALWAAFAMTLNHSLALLQRRTWLATALGAIGGPLAYLGAARGFDAVEFVAPGWRAVAALALGWGIAMPLLAWLAQRWGDAPRVAASAEPEP
ncbi:DUF2878 domain-containing protein [Luteimonas soli]|uniref:DUF2878 domain-containing protein n=1 Tax=Luteimonas soli TaxID=1648966 RepID=A0ABV7XHK2_9GAMM